MVEKRGNRKNTNHSDGPQFCDICGVCVPLCHFSGPTMASGSFIHNLLGNQPWRACFLESQAVGKHGLRPLYRTSCRCHPPPRVSIDVRNFGNPHSGAKFRPATRPNVGCNQPFRSRPRAADCAAGEVCRAGPLARKLGAGRGSLAVCPIGFVGLCRHWSP